MGIRALGLTLLALTLSGCVPGWLYTNISTPFCTNMGKVPSNAKTSRASMKSFSIPRVPGARAAWSSNAIGDAAKKNNMSVIYYCDRKQYSIIGGLWGRDEIVVYGE